MPHKYFDIAEFIRHTFNSPNGFISLHEPCFIGNEKKYLAECIDSTFVSSVGKFVDLFEEQIADYTKSAKAVVCVNGTSALHMALLLSGVERGDEVITQPLTFVATGNAINYCGAIPVFIDVDIDTMGLSPAALEKWLNDNVDYPNKNSKPVNKTTGRKISAVVPMHTFGHPCRIDEITEICSAYNIQVVEDAAESIGSFYKGQHTGTFANIGVLSFNGNKTITSGGGGMLLFNDTSKAEYAKHLTTQAKIQHKWEFSHNEIGYNYRMPNINAAVGLAQLEQLNFILNKKRILADLYQDFFQTRDIKYMVEPHFGKSNFWLNAIALNNMEERNEFLEFMNNNGIQARPIWQLLNKLSMFSKNQCGDLTNSNWLEERIVNIPSSVII
jgi:perosamine synthetase